MPRYVILTHDAPFPHWDLMFERDGALRTWRLFTSPEDSGDIPGEAISDHRLPYLDYEGPVSGGRGEVRRWDWGRYILVSDGESRVEATVDGSRLAGTVLLTRQGDGHHWTFHFEPF
jgi:hypothetical protein